MATFGGGERIVLMWLPEHMGISTANSMLKIMEEPPKDTHFILVSNDIESIPITLLSRMQIMHVRPYSKAQLSKFIQRDESIGVISYFQKRNLTGFKQE